MTSLKWLMVLLVAYLAMLPVAAGAQTPDRVARAREAFEAGRYAGAASALTSVTKSAPQDGVAFYWLGRARFELRDYARAIDALKRAVELHPENAEYHLWLGRANGEQAAREHSFWLARRVRQAFQEAIRLNPMNVVARRDLLQFFLEAPRILGGGEDKALQQVEAIAAIDPVAGHLARAAYWEHEDNLARAQAEYQAAIDAKPPRADPYFEAAEFYEKVGDRTGLGAAIEHAARVDPAEPRLAYFRGVLGLLAGRLAEAEESLKTYLRDVPARSDRPSPAATHEWLGRLYESMNRPTDAATEYRSALALEPNRKGVSERLRRLRRPPA